MAFLTQGKTNWKYILILLVLAVIVSGGILSYLGYFKREIELLTKFPEIKKQEKAVEEEKEEVAEWKIYTDEEIRKIAEELFALWLGDLNLDIYYHFLNSLFNNPADPLLVGDDEKLTTYLNENLYPLTVKRISRGRFDKKYPDKEMVVVSFEPKRGKHFFSYVIFFQEETGKRWQVLYQTIGYFEKFSNEPRKLIKDEPEFFGGATTPIGGTCLPIRWSFKLYRMENSTFNPIFETIYKIDGQIYDEKGHPIGKIEGMNTTIDFKDLDGDGNLEIIKEGTRKICKGPLGACYVADCDEVIEEEEIYQVFKWEPQKQSFLLYKKSSK